MFADAVIEGSSSLATADYTLTGAKFDSMTFGQRFNTGDTVAYVAQTLERTKVEIGVGIYSAGPPRILTRTTIIYSNQGNAKINWLVDDKYYIASFASGDALSGLVKNNMGAAKPWWLIFGRWLKQNFPTSGKHTEYFYDGTTSIERGVLDTVAHTYIPKELSATGVISFLATPNSANLATMLVDKTGTGLNVFNVSPSLTTPAIASPTMTGTVTVPTPANPTDAASKGYVDTKVPTTLSSRREYVYATIAAGVVTVVDSKGVTSLVRDSIGRYTVTMTTAMPDLKYRVSVTAGVTVSGSVPNGMISAVDNSVTRTTTVFGLVFGLDNSGLQDPTSINVEILYG